MAIICGATAGLLEPLKAALVWKEDTSAARQTNMGSQSIRISIEFVRTPKHDDFAHVKRALMRI